MPETKFRKGDRVQFQFVTRSVEGVVKEDLGPIGIKGRRLYVVEFRFGPHGESSSQIQLPAERLQLIQDTVSRE